MELFEISSKNYWIICTKNLRSDVYKSSLGPHGVSRPAWESQNKESSSQITN
jgi:hypothetical protein